MGQEENSLETLRALLYCALDVINEYMAIQLLPNCNDCGRQHECEYCPRPGMRVRFNCALWEEMK